MINTCVHFGKPSGFLHTHSPDIDPSTVWSIMGAANGTLPTIVFHMYPLRSVALAGLGGLVSSVDTVYYASSVLVQGKRLG